MLAKGFVAEMPRGNHFCLRNADAAQHETFLYYRICATGPLNPSMAPFAVLGQTAGSAGAQE